MNEKEEKKQKHEMKKAATHWRVAIFDELSKKRSTVATVRSSPAATVLFVHVLCKTTAMAAAAVAAESRQYTQTSLRSREKEKKKREFCRKRRLNKLSKRCVCTRRGDKTINSHSHTGNERNSNGKEIEHFGLCARTVDCVE